MNIVIPLNGEGSRFRAADFYDKKPFIRAGGKGFLFWLLDNVNSTRVKHVIVPYAASLQQYNIEEVLKIRYNLMNFVFIPLHFNTSGALETVYFALTKLKSQYPQDAGFPLLSLDADTYYSCDIVEQFKGQQDMLFAFETTGREPIYSYVTDDGNGYVAEIAEKQKISDLACSGAYGFANGDELLARINKVLASSNNLQKGEFYISSVIRDMLSHGSKFVISKLPPKDIKCYGTPLEYMMSFEPDTKIKLRICFDFDNSLVTPGDCMTVVPIERTIAYLRHLKAAGHTIIIHTERMITDAKIVKTILKRFDIPFDELYFGKPHAHFYIDDLAIPASCDLNKAIGLFDRKQIAPRDFHTIQITDDKVFKESKHIKGLEGEIYFYRNIPKSCKHLFPILLEFDEISQQKLVITKIDGLTFSHLYIEKALTVDVFKKLLSELHTLHSSDTCATVDIYSLYIPKLKARLQSLRNPANVEQLAQNCFEYFETYQKQKSGKVGVVHGDPVFTNLFLDRTGEIKFIDMRGRINQSCSIYGDIHYDYAKIYQSLIGYDEILMNTQLSISYRTLFINAFDQHITSILGSDALIHIKYVTISLLLSLLPLHSPNYHEKFLFLAQHVYHTAAI